MQPKALLVLLLFALAGTAYAARHVWEAASHNINLSGSLLGSNACGFASRAPSEDDAFAYAGIRAVSLIPQVDNVTSDLSSPMLLWSWAAGAPEEVSFRLPGTTECPGGEMRLFSRSAISFSEGKLHYSYGNASMETALASGGPNPVPLALDRGWLRGSDFSQLYAPLQVRLSAKASVEYSFRRRELFKTCEHHENFTLCYCEEKITRGKRKYERRMEDARNFSVEVGPVQELWLNPPLLSRLEGEGEGRVLFLARRMPASIAASSDGEKIASASPYSFEESLGPCGEKRVKSAYAPSGENALIANWSQALFPHQLVDKNASYLPFYLRFNWSQGAGRHKLVLEYEDWFSNKISFPRNFSVRKPEAFSADAGEGAAMAIREGGGGVSPAAYPSGEKSGALPRVAPLAALAAFPFALGAIGILRWLRKIQP